MTVRGPDRRYRPKGLSEERPGAVVPEDRGEFISGCLGNRTDQLVIAAVVRIAHGMGKETIAEFVSVAQLERFVRSQGVDHAQGFHVGVPAPVPELWLGRLHKSAA